MAGFDAKDIPFASPAPDLLDIADPINSVRGNPGERNVGGNCAVDPRDGERGLRSERGILSSSGSDPYLWAPPSRMRLTLQPPVQ